MLLIIFVGVDLFFPEINKVLRSSPCCFVFTSSASIIIISAEQFLLFIFNMNISNSVKEQQMDSLHGCLNLPDNIRIPPHSPLNSSPSNMLFFCIVSEILVDPQKKGLGWDNWLDLNHRPRCWSVHGKIFAHVHFYMLVEADLEEGVFHQQGRFY